MKAPPGGCELNEWLRAGSGHIHFLGIGGVGMAGLAFHLHQLGFQVTGCDQETGPLFPWLRQAGLHPAAGHDASHVDETVDLVIRTPAVRMDHPEIQQAGKLHVPVLKRGEVLPALQRLFRSVAVSGTHGKTTTSTILASMLREGGVDAGFCIGGLIRGGAAEPAGEWLVLEADESDGTLVHYAPEIGVITNIEYDHMEHFDSEKEFLRIFDVFAEQVSGQLHCCQDDLFSAQLAGRHTHAVGFGFSEEAACRGEILAEEEQASHVRISRCGETWGDLYVPLPGRHNVMNVLGAVSAAGSFNLPLASIQAGLNAYRPPARRFETVFQDEDYRVISDYAHHPSEIRAVIEAAGRLGHRRICAVYQPHRYTRTLALGADFPASFEGLDLLVLAPVYAASEDPLDGGTSADLFKRIASERTRPVLLADSLNEAGQQLLDNLEKGDLVLVLGAGDVDQLVPLLKDELAKSKAGR